MKKLFALTLALCLLCGCSAMAEADAELTWDAALEERGTTQQIDIEGVGTFLYWIPGNLREIDSKEIQAEPAMIAAFGTEGAEFTYTVTVYMLEVESLEAYAAAQQENGADIENAKLILTNGIQVVGFENKTENFEMCIIPITKTQILVFAFTPCDGDDEWDEEKGNIVSSIRLAE